MRAVRFRMKRGKSTFNLNIPKGIKGNDIYIPDLVSVGGDYFGDLDFLNLSQLDHNLIDASLARSGRGVSE